MPPDNHACCIQPPPPCDARNFFANQAWPQTVNVVLSNIAAPGFGVFPCDCSPLAGTTIVLDSGVGGASWGTYITLSCTQPPGSCALVYRVTAFISCANLLVNGAWTVIYSWAVNLQQSANYIQPCPPVTQMSYSLSAGSWGGHVAAGATSFALPLGAPAQSTSCEAGTGSTATVSF